MKHGSLFSGYGGLDLAIADVFGAETAWASDIEPASARVLAHHYPDAPNLGDITTVDWQTVERVDIISGGSPCQDLSHAGRRAGMTEGTRSNLWVSMREAIATLRPRFVVWENVRGAMSADADSALEHCPGCMGDPRDRGPVLRALGRVLGDLADLGYDAQWHGLRAADVGACHGRWRVFVLAYAHGAGLQGQPHPQGTAPTERHGHALAGAGGPDLALLPTPEAGLGDHGRANGVHPDTRIGRQVSLADIACHLLIWGDYTEAIARHERALGRPAPEPTEPNARGGRRLSAAFVEWMMMLPAGWVTDRDVTRNEALKMLGNGVVPAQAAAALRLMLARMESAA